MGPPVRVASILEKASETATSGADALVLLGDTGWPRGLVREYGFFPRTSYLNRLDTPRNTRQVTYYACSFTLHS